MIFPSPQFSARFDPYTSVAFINTGSKSES
jgi:hypothetical protein